MNLRRRRAHPVTVALLCALPTALAWSGAPSAGATGVDLKPYTRQVEPWIPGVPPSTPPVVDLTAACVRPVGGQLEAVFGYDNPGDLSVEVPLEADGGGFDDGNAIVRETLRLHPPRRVVTVENTGPQATQFLPGHHPHVFAVRFNLNETVAWQVRIPSSDDPVIDPGWKVTVRPRLLAPCGPRVPGHFAVVQTARVSFSPARVVEDADGITAHHIEETAVGVRTVCSAGGRVLPFEQDVGWPIHPNLAPLRRNEIIRTVTVDSGAVFQMSDTPIRRVLDVTKRIDWLGPIADVIGRCAFPGRVVKSEVFWAGLPQNGHIVPEIVDGAVVKLILELELPGGFRIR